MLYAFVFFRFAGDGGQGGVVWSKFVFRERGRLQAREFAGDFMVRYKTADFARAAEMSAWCKRVTYILFWGMLQSVETGAADSNTQPSW